MSVLPSKTSRTRRDAKYRRVASGAGEKPREAIKDLLALLQHTESVVSGLETVLDQTYRRADEVAAELSRERAERSRHLQEALREAKFTEDALRRENENLRRQVDNFERASKVLNSNLQTLADSEIDLMADVRQLKEDVLYSVRHARLGRKQADDLTKELKKAPHYDAVSARRMELRA